MQREELIAASHRRGKSTDSSGRSRMKFTRRRFSVTATARVSVAPPVSVRRSRSCRASELTCRLCQLPKVHLLSNFSRCASSIIIRFAARDPCEPKSDSASTLREALVTTRNALARRIQTNDRATAEMIRRKWLADSA